VISAGNSSLIVFTSPCPIKLAASIPLFVDVLHISWMKPTSWVKINFGNRIKERSKVYLIKESYTEKVPVNVNPLDKSLGTELQNVTKYKYNLNISANSNNIKTVVTSCLKKIQYRKRLHTSDVATRLKRREMQKVYSTVFFIVLSLENFTTHVSFGIHCKKYMIRQTSA
jgi:hypothetical protein